MYEKDLVSIVIINYNQQEYLPTCLDSLINQTYKNIEIIIADDGSTDNSRKILLDYSHKDERVKPYFKENTGISDTRNFGLSKVKGEYFMFVDSDDWVNTKMVETLHNLIIKDKVDCAVCGFTVKYKYFNLYRKAPSNKIINNIEALDLIMDDSAINNYPWGKLFKTSLFTYEFHVGYNFFEDVETIYKYFIHTNNVACTSKRLYYYRQHLGSATSKMNNSLTEKMYNSFKNQADYLNEQVDNHTFDPSLNYWRTNFMIIRNMLKMDNDKFNNSYLYKYNRKSVNPFFNFLLDASCLILKIKHLNLKKKMYKD